MSIIQISKIQQRSGDLVDLPQLDEAEFGFASDQKLLFIGKTVGSTENVEVLTAYSEIAFSQLNGAVGNLDIEANVANGQVLVFNNGYWVNAGGNASSPANSTYWTSTPIHLGGVDNLYIGGGAIGYVLTTDGSGGLNWTPKGTVVQNINTISQSADANVPARLTLQQPYPFDQGAEITINMISNSSGTYATNLNGDNFFLKPVPGNIQLYDLYKDSALLIPQSTTDNLSNVQITGNNGQFSCNTATLVANLPVTISGTLSGTGSISGYTNPTTYYIKGTPTSTSFVLSTTLGGNAITTTLGTTTGLNFAVGYGTYPTNTGIVIFNTVSANGGEPGGSNLSVQYNSGADFAGDAVFLYDYTNKNLTLGNATTVANIYANGGTIGANRLSGTITTAAQPNITSTGNLTVPNLTVSGTSNLGDIANIKIYGNATAGQVVATDGLGNLYWSNGGAGNENSGYYLHTQSSANTVWTVVHNLNTTYVDVTPIFANNISMRGRYDYPVINYVNANAVTLTFSSAYTGFAAITGNVSEPAGYYLHNQSVASSTWTVTHNLGSQFVSVVPVDSSGNSWFGKYDAPLITYNNATSTTLTFSTAQTGNVAFIGSSNISGYYVHNQSVASNTWVVQHDLGTKYVSVTPVQDSSNSGFIDRYDFPEIAYNNSNAVTLTFSSAVAGNVVIVGGGESYPAAGSNTEVQFNNGGALDGDSDFTFDNVNNILTVPFVRLSVVTFANLPAAAVAGRKAFISDANLIASGNFGSLVSGGGSNTVPVYSDGTNWRIG